MESYLMDLELRLHLAAEDVDVALEMDSARALQRIPAAVQEITHLKADAMGLKGDIRRGLVSVSTAASTASMSVATLAELDLAKSRMEAACSTLQQATELSAHFARIKSVFAEGDLQRIAATLASIRQGLALVGNVPEFRGGSAKLAALEERFNAMIEPAVSSALAARHADRVANLAMLMANAGREHELEGLYIAARLPMLQGLWDGFEGRGFAAWLPSFYDAVLNAASSEARWCASALPDSHPGLLLQLLSALFSRIEKPFRTRLASALVQGGDKDGGVLMLLAGMLEAAHTFVQKAAQLAAQEGVSSPMLLPAAVYPPFQPQLDRYGELEEVSFGESLAAVMLPEIGEDLDSAVSSLSAFAAATESALSSALARCQQATGMLGLPELQFVADEGLARFAGRLQAALMEIRTQQAAASSGKAEVEDSTAVLQLLGVAKTLLANVTACETAIRSAVADLRRVVDSAAATSPDALDPITFRLHTNEGQLLRQLQAFAITAQSSYLPSFTQRAQDFHEGVQALVYDVLMLKVHGSLEGLGSQPVWQQEDASASAGGGVLPSFSAYPQQSVTSAGEYLMMMPQTLEGLLGSGDDAEDQMDSEWLDKVAAGAARVYVQELSSIKRLTEAGSAQLAADLDYFCNVLAALGVALPPQLVTWQAAMTWDAGDFAQSAARAREEESVDPDTLQLIGAARGLQLP
ncbi:g4090 [Coccomyxa viridis]|uniref:Conserved oligomeric Golgi complex subunit 7 n=1 Tax=Coccomyxa viridis TaxID=1274662 RepID=A0ABP1FWH3_9CHLO